MFAAAPHELIDFRSREIYSLGRSVSTKKRKKRRKRVKRTLHTCTKLEQLFFIVVDERSAICNRNNAG